MTTGIEYEIRTLADFEKIPPNKLHSCLDDFRFWLLLIKTTESMPDGVCDALGVEPSKIEFDRESFVWIDDGIAGLGDIAFTVDGAEIGRLKFSEHPE